MRKETESNVTGDVPIASINHSPLHKSRFAQLPVEKVLENARHAKLTSTCPQQPAPHPQCAPCTLAKGVTAHSKLISVLQVCVLAFIIFAIVDLFWCYMKAVCTGICAYFVLCCIHLSSMLLKILSQTQVYKNLFLLEKNKLGVGDCRY